MENINTAYEPHRFLSFKQVQGLTGMSRSTIYRQIKEGRFPKARAISTRKVGFLMADLEHWFKERAAN